MSNWHEKKQKFYLLATLLETQDCVSDGHALYATLDDAMAAFEQEIADCQENFNEWHGSALIDLPRCKEWRTEDGYGYTVTVDEMIPL